MTYNALAMALSERFSESGKMLVIGTGTVFAALAVLWLVLVVFRALANAPTGKKNKKAPDIVLEETPPAEAVTPIILSNNSNDDAVIAVITAAVAATLAAENGGAVQGFRVVSFRRADQKK